MSLRFGFTPTSPTYSHYRRISAVALAGAALGMLAIASGFADAQGYRCPIPRSRLIAADTKVQVFDVHGRVYACRMGSHRARFLDSHGGTSLVSATDLRHLRVAGRYVAYELARSGQEGEQFY